MEIQQNQDLNLPDQSPEVNNTTNRWNDWLELGRDIPAGLFYQDPSAGVVHLNSKLLAYLKQEQMPISPVLEEYFWSRLEAIAEDPVLARVSINEARTRLDSGMSAEIRLIIGNDQCLLIRLFRFHSEESGEQPYGGILIDQIDERTVYLRQIKMLEELSVLSRKNNASAMGNLNALIDNLHAWSQDVLDDFLLEAQEYLAQVNKSLDLSLNLIQAFDTFPVFSDTVNLIELIHEVISERHEGEYRLLADQEYETTPPVAFLDPALTRLALEYLLDEISSSNAEGQPIDLSLTMAETDLMVGLESTRTLPLPGLNPDQIELRVIDQNIKTYLAEKIINSLGGSISYYGQEPGSGSISRIEIRLPYASSPIIEQKPDPSQIKNNIEGRVLLAEAQSEYQVVLRESLQEAGYRVDLAADGSSALDMAQAITPDLIIVARNLPGLDGLLVTQGIRRWSAIPIIMLSERSDQGDLLYAYQLGVDDYLRKPISTSELLVRAQVCMRRSANARNPFVPEIYQSSLIRIDYSSRQVWIRGKPVSLTPIEYNLLVFMSRQGKQIMPYEQLLESVWEGPEKGTRQGLFVHVKRLREKIEIDPKNPQIINNKWGVGYEFNP
jgi:two-component system KDP operon response regulator KdpE